MDSSVSVYSGHSRTTARFPFGKLIILLATLLIWTMVIYRLSEAAGQSFEIACLMAIAVSAVAAIAGLLPLSNVWGKELLRIVLSIFLSGLIRLLIGFLGVVIIILFTDIDRIWFVFFLGLFYTVFLVADIRLVLWILKNAEIKEDENGKSVIHGNLWDTVIKH